MVAFSVAAAPAASASLSSHLIDTSSQFSAGTLQLEGQTATNCYSTGSGSGGTVMTNSAICPGSPLPTGGLSTSAVLSASSTLRSVGTSNPATGAVTLVSCGVAEVGDSSVSADTGLVYGAVTYGSAFVSPVSPGFTASGIGLSGATGTYVGTVATLTSPVSFTLVAWVKTTSTSGGGIIGFSNVQPDVHASSQDRMLWVEPSGDVAFGVQNRLSMMELVSSVAVNDGGWHFVAASFSASGSALDVDGSTVTNSGATFPLTYAGYWHLGWAGNSSWANAGTNEYLAGSLYGVAVFGAGLSAANLTTLENASSASGYASAVSSLSPTADWPLSDVGATAYTGTIPALGTSQVCQQVLFEVQTTQGSNVVCVYPNSAGACPSTPPSTATLGALTTSPMAPTSSSSAVGILVRVTLATASVPGVIGLHLLADVGLAIALGGWTAEVSYPSPALEM